MWTMTSRRTRLSAQGLSAGLVLAAVLCARCAAPAEKGREQEWGQRAEVQRAEQSPKTPAVKGAAYTPIRVGALAPDFELRRLTFVKDKNGKTVGRLSKKKIALSSFRGKKPVCLIFSSYT